MARAHPIAPIPILTLADALGPDNGTVLPLYTCEEMADGTRGDFEFAGSTSVAEHLRSQPWSKYIQHDFDKDDYGQMRALRVHVQGF